MQIRLRNVLAVGALSAGLLTGGALVANAATTSTTTGNSGTSATSNSSTTTPSTGTSTGELGTEQQLGLVRVVRDVVGLQLQFEFGHRLHPQLPQHGQRLGLRYGHASRRLWNPTVVRLQPGVDIGLVTPTSHPHPR